MHSSFLVPKIQPDELLAGYRGRIAAWNGCESSREVALGMLKQYPLAARLTCHTSQFIEAAALANGMAFMELIREHTMYILLADGSRQDLLALKQARALSTLASMAMHSNTERLWGCEACMHADLQRLNSSYWRRSHQVPGRGICLQHGSLLRSIRKTPLPPGGPAHSESFIDPRQPQATSADSQSPGCAFAVAILDEMMRTFRRPEQQTVAKAIRAGLRAQGIDPSSSGKRKILQAALTDHFTPAWLESVAGKLGSKPAALRRKIGQVLDARGSSPPVDIAIVARLAFTDIENALVSFGLHPRTPTHRPESK